MGVLRVIEFSSVTKVIGDRQILDALTLRVGRGRIMGLLGPNGAGKTTTIRLLTGVWKPTSGRVQVGGHDMVTAPEDGRRLLGVVPSETALYEQLSVWENVMLVADYYGDEQAVAERARALLTELGLAGELRQLGERLSKGMKQKVAIARALAHAPEILVLDEPTSGLDVASTDALERFIRTLHESGSTILLCTHDMHQALRVCDEILVLYRGRTFWQGDRRLIPSAAWLSDLLIHAGEGRGESHAEQTDSLAGRTPSPDPTDLP